MVSQRGYGLAGVRQEVGKGDNSRWLCTLSVLPHYYMHPNLQGAILQELLHLRKTEAQ